MAGPESRPSADPLEEMAARDGLTRLLNRQTFEFCACGPVNDATVSCAYVANVADQALYTAKHRGRDRCVLFDVRTARDLSAGSASAGDRTGRAEARMLQVTNPLAGTTPAPG
jgi:hypothetical protein